MQSSPQTWQTWQQFVNGMLPIDDHILMSHYSRFGDDIWDFYDSTNNRYLGRSPGSFRINWYQYAPTLPPAVLSSVKVLGFFVVHYPAALNIFQKASRKGLKPATYCKSLSDLLGFLELLCLHSCLPAACIHTLADFTLADIEKTLPQWPRIGKARNQLRFLLMALASPLIQPYLPSLTPQSPAVLWTKHDIATIDFCQIVAHDHDREVYSDKPLPDALFCLLVNAATRDVLSFLAHLGCSPYTPLPFAGNLENKSLTSHPDFGKIYEAFLAVKGTRYNAKQRGEKMRSVFQLWLSYKHQFNVSYQEVKTAITRIQRAARYLLLQFTGLRFSEAVQLQTGCVHQLPSGEYVIKATAIKNKSINVLQGADYWIACPIARDAIVVLEEFTRFTHSTYLFASNMHSLLQDSGKPMSNKSFTAFLNTYLYDLDEQRHYSVFMSAKQHRHKGVLAPYWLTPHRLRHTLALHMSRAGLGIPFISLHLKHMYQAYKRFQSISDVTLSYGNLGHDIFNNALGLQQAHREMVHAIYHPDAPITGPGATEFKANRKVYFTGMLAAGWQEDEIMNYLVGRGVLMADVGLAYCQGRREIVAEDGSKALPPCLGQLKCNPTRCKNAVIPSSKIAIWVQVYTENRRRLQDPLMSYAWPEYRYFMEEAQQVLLHLGINLEHL